MVDMLGFIGDKLIEADIPYEFGEWTSTVSYPYFVGSFVETEYRFEDNCTIGTFTLDGWSRGSKLSLTEINDKVKKIFSDLQMVQEDTAFYVRYGGSMTVPSGEADLFRISITLYTYEWKGE
jgi:hypothetical protein